MMLSTASMPPRDNSTGEAAVTVLTIWSMTSSLRCKRVAAYVGVCAGWPFFSQGAC